MTPCEFKTYLAEWLEANNIESQLLSRALDKDDAYIYNLLYRPAPEKYRNHLIEKVLAGLPIALKLEQLETSRYQSWLLDG